MTITTHSAAISAIKLSIVRDKNYLRQWEDRLHQDHILAVQRKIAGKLHSIEVLEELDNEN